MMKKLIRFAWTAMIVLVWKFAPAQAQEAAGEALTVPTVAVLPFETRDRQSGNMDFGKSISELLSVALMEKDCAELVERAELDKALTELQLSATGMTDREKQTRLGKLIGAKILVTGSIFRSGDKNFIVAKIVGTETSRVLGASVSSGNDFVEMIPELSEKISEHLENRSAVLLPEQEKTDTIAEQLARNVQGKGRKVFVNVKENISVHVPDPAVETELKKLLLSLGFEIAPNRDGADFAVIGEAIAANSGSYRHFTSATGRVELSIYDKNKKLLATSAGKETLAGGSYVIAAKEALAQATLRLAKELFPVLK